MATSHFIYNRSNTTKQLFYVFKHVQTHLSWKQKKNLIVEWAASASLIFYISSSYDIVWANKYWSEKNTIYSNIKLRRKIATSYYNNINQNWNRNQFINGSSKLFFFSDLLKNHCFFSLICSTDIWCFFTLYEGCSSIIIDMIVCLAMWWNCFLLTNNFNGHVFNEHCRYTR